ncbi:TonB-dependent receptor [Henriciella sp.]|jgi:iron complex outermembrane recepter protein|uniref:TonB-dependent receptor domain-containing protein n=1 Tax=Henriciella sp. TaxID=1968823 RepID=UPI0017A83BF7|nr:TonB-dependent receptor [Henriciella sp.]HIG23737.1 TonB-dependent receptor [Henriciella sp.]
MRNANKWLLATSVLALSAAGAAHAQNDEGEDTLRQQTVTVTGSAIAGTPEDAALPVDVLSAGDLQLEGSPSITELIRNLGVSTGVDGQTNQFSSNGLEGTSNINLRGLGPGRTLVLLNGKRQTFAPYGVGEQAQLFVDTNVIPSAAIGRIEVLKDGAAAVYGSDAIAGVVNFITRDDLEGFEISAQYETFEGSDGEYDISAAYGLQGDNWNWVTSAGYQFRSEVGLIEKDWAVRPYNENPVGGWSSLSNPGRYVPLGIVGGAVRPLAANVNDVGCDDVGGFQNPNVAAVNQCYFQFTQFDNLVEEEERYQIFSEYNHTFGNGINFHLEGLYAHTDVPEWKTSPSYPPQEVANQVIPGNSPGFLQYRADNPGLFPANTIAALFIGRSFAWGGFPATGGAQEGFRTYDSYRLAGSFDGEFENGVTWNAGLTFHETEGERITNDTYIRGFTAALNGFGVCTDPATGFDPATGTQPWGNPAYTGSLVQGQGSCEWYNPFSNGIAANAITGQANPTYVPGLENSVTLADWLTEGVGTVVTSNLLVFDAAMSGQSNVVAQGGPVSWAVGAQVRREGFEVEPNDVTNLAVSPGPGGTGPFSFLAGTNASDRDQTIYAIFGELQIPLYDNLNVQVATRYEDYGGEIGSTFDPKVAVKWQATDNFALRGSAQTSFKGPTLNQIDGQVTTLQFVAPASAFKAVDQFGNPQLNPESAFSFNLGALFDNNNGFTASVDYYNFDFSDPIIVEDQSEIVPAALAALAAGNNDAAILSRITFTDANNDGINQANEVSRVRTNVVNGPDIKTSGVDFRAEQVWDLGPNEFSLGLEATYIIEYDVDDFAVEDVIIPGGDRVGQFNRSNFSRSLPQWKANITANYAFGNHNLRGVIRHVDSYDDERGTPNLQGAFVGGPSEIDSMTTLDAFYTWRSDYDLDLGLSVVNVFDEDPPLAYFDVSYDPYTHNPFGRTFKISLTKRFGGN